MQDKTVKLGLYKQRNGAARTVTKADDDTVTFVTGPRPPGRGRYYDEGTEVTVKTVSFLVWMRGCKVRP